MTRNWRLSRRRFLIGTAVLGGGVVVGLPLSLPYLRRRAFQFLSHGGTPGGTIEGDPLLWFELSEGNILNIYVTKVEMGQGAHTALGQIAAEELEMLWSNVRVHQAGTLLGPVDSFGTGGSSSISGLYLPLRQLAANYRVMLSQAAQQVMGSKINLSDGVFRDSSGAEMTLYAASRLEYDWEEIEEDAPLKPPSQFNLIGQSLSRLDIRGKLTAEPMYAYDMQADTGTTYYGAVARPPAIGSKMGEVNIQAAISMPRVLDIVTRENFVAVVAETRESAREALKSVDIEWENGLQFNQYDIDEMLEPASPDAIELKRVGNPQASLESPNIVVHEYSTPVAATAPLEPQSSLAEMGEDGIMRVHTPTQFPNQTTIAVSRALDLDKSRVDVIPTYLGGGFGRRQRAESAVEAAILAFETGLPVHVGWTREEEFLLDRFRPPTRHKLSAAMSNDGRIIALEHRQSSGDVFLAELPKIPAGLLGSDFGATRGMDPMYDIPNLSLYAHRANLPVPTSAWRGLGLLANTFATESFVDELAAIAGIDPIIFRVDHLLGEVGNRVKTVLDIVAEMALWPGNSNNGSALGVSCCIDYGTIVAQIAQVKVVDNTIHVPRIWAAMDCGLVVNPDGAVNQVEGNIIWGLGSALKESIAFRDGKPTASNFGGYPLLRMDEAPDISVKLVPSDRPPQGVGEPAIGPVASAVANAIYAATGTRLRKLPLTMLT